MSRAIDILLLGALAFLGWKLVHMDRGRAAASARASSPITVSVVVRGDVPLEGLVTLLRPAGERARRSEVSGEPAPHQLSPFDSDRQALILVPKAGRYELRWAAQGQALPQRPRNVVGELERNATQHIEVSAAMLEPIEIELDGAHAEGLRTLSSRSR